MALGWKLYRGKADERFAVPHWEVQVPIFIFLGWAAAAVYLLTPAVVVSLFGKHLSQSDLPAVATLASSLPVILFFWIMSWNEKESTLSFGQLSCERLPWLKAMRIAFYSLLWLFPILVGVAQLWDRVYILWEKMGIPVERTEQIAIELVNKADSPLTLGLLLLSIVVLVPISEELLFRGLLYRYMKTRMKPLTAIAVSGFCFSILHDSIQAFLPLLLLGMILSYVYEITGSLRVPILLHALFNLINLMFMFNTPEALPVT